LTRLLVVVVLLILYGSLYPWRFSAPPGGIASVVRHLASGAGALYVRDALLNIVFYMPVGAVAYLTFRSFARPIFAAVLAVVFGAWLSTGIEIAQAYEGSRRTSVYDVYSNVLGSIFGAAVATVFSKLSGFLNRTPGLHVVDGGALALLVCWAAYLLFPFVPEMSQRMVRAKLTAADRMDELGFATAVLVWLVVGLALKASAFRHPIVLCFVSVLAIPAQLLIAGQSPTASTLAGALLGAVIFAVTNRLPGRTKGVAVAVLLLVVFRGLWPMQVSVLPQSFNWIPFASMLEANWQRASQVLVEKLFFYGSAIWLLREAGMKLRTAAMFTAAVLFVVEALQLRTNRTPEITDPLLALMIGFGLHAFHPQPRRTSSLSGTSASSIR
jgi:glycopeptide antibiotics resistance protein